MILHHLQNKVHIYFLPIIVACFYSIVVIIVIIIIAVSLSVSYLFTHKRGVAIEYYWRNGPSIVRATCKLYSIAMNIIIPIHLL